MAKHHLAQSLGQMPGSEQVAADLGMGHAHAAPLHLDEGSSFPGPRLEHGTVDLRVAVPGGDHPQVREKSGHEGLFGIAGSDPGGDEA